MYSVSLSLNSNSLSLPTSFSVSKFCSRYSLFPVSIAVSSEFLRFDGYYQFISLPQRALYLHKYHRKSHKCKTVLSCPLGDSTAFQRSVLDQTIVLTTVKAVLWVILTPPSPAPALIVTKKMLRVGHRFLLSIYKTF